MDFSIPDEYRALQIRIRQLVEQHIIPLETDPRWGDHGPSDELRIHLNGLAGQHGLLAPQVVKQYGGLGLSHLGRAIVFEAAGYSMLGPIALHCAAPDEGNMHLLEAVANHGQKERWLRGLARARIRSCFSMASGYRIGPMEVENALLEHPAVLACAVVGSPDQHRGEIVRAFIVLRSEYIGTDALVAELQVHAKSLTAPYKYPRAIEFVEALPRTMTGKIRRRELRDKEVERQRRETA